MSCAILIYLDTQLFTPILYRAGASHTTHFQFLTLGYEQTQPPLSW